MATETPPHFQGRSIFDFGDNICHERKSLGLFDHLRGAVAGASLICPNDVGTGSNRDVLSEVTVEPLGYFKET